jgi:hypothetical protein
MEDAKAANCLQLSSPIYKFKWGLKLKNNISSSKVPRSRWTCGRNLMCGDENFKFLTVFIVLLNKSGICLLGD